MDLDQNDNFPNDYFQPGQLVLKKNHFVCEQQLKHDHSSLHVA